MIVDVPVLFVSTKKFCNGKNFFSKSGNNFAFLIVYYGARKKTKALAKQYIP